MLPCLAPVPPHQHRYPAAQTDRPDTAWQQFSVTHSSSWWKFTSSHRHFHPRLRGSDRPPSSHSQKGEFRRVGSTLVRPLRGGIAAGTAPSTTTITITFYDWWKLTKFPYRRSILLPLVREPFSLICRSPPLR